MQDASRSGLSELSQQQYRLAVKRTNLRYARAALSDRLYVHFKLQMDPVARALCGLGHLGDVLDIGAGRGQFGLLLLEAGLASGVEGFDSDERKVIAAARAAAGEAHFEHVRIQCRELPAADSVLLIDVLHYLPPAEQERLLQRIVASLKPGGRVLIRETDAGSPLKSWWARSAERIAGRVGINRSDGLSFLTGDHLQQMLRAVGLSGARVKAHRSQISNMFVLAERSPGQSNSSSKGFEKVS